MQPVQAVADRRVEAARRKSPAAVETALRVRGYVVDDACAGDHAFVVVERVLEQAARVRTVADHEVLADDAARVREAVREARRLRQQQQTRGLGPVGRQHDDLRLLEVLALVGVEVSRTGDAAARVDRDLAHVAPGPNFAIAARHRERQHRDRRARARAHVTAEARAHSAVHARGPAHVGARDDRERAWDHRETQLARGRLEQRARRLHRHGRHGVILLHRCHERRVHTQPRNAHLPFRLRVVRFDFVVRDRPVREARARDLADMARFVELPRQMPPAAPAVGHGAAANDAAIGMRARRRFLLVRAAERISLPRWIAHQAILGRGITVRELVLRVLPVATVLAPAALLEHDNGEARRRDLFGHDAAGGARTDDDEVDLGVR